MPSEVDAADALRRGRTLGPFYAIDLDIDPAQWQRFSDLLERDGAGLSDQLEQTRQTLASMSRVEPDRVEPRVAASLWLLGWAARVFAPSLGAALHGVVPALRPEQLLWQASPGQPRPLAAIDPRGWTCVPGDAEGAATLLYDGCITTLVAPLVAALHSSYSVSLNVLWGNVASAVAGAATSLGPPATRTSRAARDIAQALLTIGVLSGRGGFTRADGSGGPSGPRGFQRSSCCLLYRIAGAGICSDCVLRPDPAG